MANGDWLYSTQHRQPCKILDSESLWGETFYRVWLVDQDSVVRVPADSLTSLDQLGPPDVASIAYVTAAARVADALNQDILLKVANTYRKINKYNKAQEFYKRALKVNPASEIVLLNLAACLGKYDRYDDDLKESLKQFDSYKDTCFPAYLNKPEPWKRTLGKRPRRVSPRYKKYNPGCPSVASLCGRRLSPLRLEDQCRPRPRFRPHAGSRR